MQRGGLREPIGGGARECLVTGVWAPNVGEPLDINWQPDGRGHGQFGRLPTPVTESLEKELDAARTACGVRHPDEAAALIRALDALATQVSATWFGAQDAVDAIRANRANSGSRP